MKTCDKCNEQYEESLDNCPSCQEKAGAAVDFDDGWVCITTVDNDIEYEMVAGLLEIADIPAVKKLKGMDGFFKVILGVPLKGIDVFVPKDRYEEAKQLLESEVDESDWQQGEAE